MPRSGTLIAYGRRIERVVAHLAAHLDEPLDLDRLAGVACFSPYHFHRIYRAVTGETAADTLRRQRLMRAAAELVREGAAMPAIARRAGYGSVAAFTRAFGQAYGIAPAAYRRQGRLVPPRTASNEPEASMDDVIIRDLSPLRVAALAHRGPYITIGTSFDRLAAWAGPRGLMGPDARYFGVYYDDPDSVPADRLRSDACITVGPEVEGDGEVRIIEIAGGPHAVLRHQGPYAELEAAYNSLYRGWLPASGREPADRPCFEEYLNDCKTLPPAEWLTDICLPLA